MLKSLLRFCSCTLLLACVASVTLPAQSSSRANPEVSTTAKTGDIQLRTGGAALNIHYAIVPLSVKGEASFYTRFDRALAVKNVITDVSGKVIKTWASEGNSAQCFINISQDAFEQTPATGPSFTWIISTVDGAELCRVSFTAADALGK